MSEKSKSSVDSRFIIDPAFRQKTNLGTYVEGHTLVKAFRPRGPAPLPAREPLRHFSVANAIIPPIESEGHERFRDLPEFSLQDFVQMLAERERVPLVKVEKVPTRFELRQAKNLLDVSLNVLFLADHVLATEFQETSQNARSVSVSVEPGVRAATKRPAGRFRSLSKFLKLFTPFSMN